MSEYVQALELQIKDNADQAARGLDSLAQTLRGIKGAISKTANLSDVATRIAKFSGEINGIATQDNITRMNKLASAIDRLVKATNGMQSVKGVSERVKNAATQIATGGIAPQTDRLAEPVAEAKQKVGEMTTDIKQASTSAEQLVDNFLKANTPLERAKAVVEELTQKLGALLSSGSPSAGKVNTLSNQLEKAKAKVKELEKNEMEATKKSDELAASLRRVAEVPISTDPKVVGQDGPVPKGLFPFGGGEGGKIEPFVAGIKNANHALREQQESLRMNNSEAEALGRAYVEMNGSVGMLATKSQQAAIALGKGIASGDMSLAQQARAGLALQNTDRQLKKEEEISAKTAITADNAMRFADAFLLANGYMGLTAMKIQEMKAELGRGVMTGTMSNEDAAALGLRITAAELNMEKKKEAAATAEAKEQLRKYKEEQKAAAKAAKEAAQSAKEHKAALSSLAKSFTGVVSGLKSFARVAKYRAFRSLIREITEGFSTGLTNVRQYSKAINGLYSKDMQGLDNTLLKMKNSLGAAVAPAIQAMIPLFQRLANAVIDVSNIINQFFALLNGSATWTRAINVDTAELEEMDKAAKGAGGSMKNLLASWDELNIIQSQSGGIGSGSKEDLTKFTKMFEEVDIFDSKVRSLVDFVKNNLGLIEEALGVILLKMAGMSLGAASLTMSVIISYDRGMQAGLEGKTWLQSLVDDLPQILLGGIGGALLGAQFGLSVGHPVAGAIIGLVAGVAVSLVANIVGWIKGSTVRKYRIMAELAAQMQEDFSRTYGVDVELAANVMDAHVADVEAAKGKVQEAATDMGDTYTLWLSSKVRNDENAIEGLKQSVAGVVNAVNDRAEAEKLFILLSFGTETSDGKYTLGELENSLIEGIGVETTIINSIGREIGRILAEGTADEYEIVLPRLMDILREFTDMQYMSKFGTEYDLAMNKAANGLFYTDKNGNQVTDVERLGAYMEAHNEAIRPLREAAESVVNTEVGTARRVWENLKYYQDNIEALRGTDTERDVNKYLAEKNLSLEDAVTDAENTYRELVEGFETKVDDLIRKTIGSDSTYYNNILKAYEMIDYLNAQNGLTNPQGIAFRLAAGNSKDRMLGDLVGLYQGILVERSENGFRAKASVSESDERYEFLSSLAESINNTVDMIYGTYGPDGIQQVIDAITSSGANNPNTPGGRWANALGGLYHGVTEAYGQKFFVVAIDGNYYGIPVNDTSLTPGDVDVANPKDILGDEFFASFGSSMPDLINEVVQETLNETPADSQGFDLRRFFHLDDGTNGRLPNGTVSASAFKTSGVSYDTYVDKNYGIVNGGSAPSVADTGDDDDDGSEETNRLLRDILSDLAFIRNKEFTAKLVANANTGRLMRTAISQAERVYGV